MTHQRTEWIYGLIFVALLDGAVAIVILLSMYLLHSQAHVHDAPLSQTAQNFLNEQKVPQGNMKGQSCCSQGDASMVEEDIRYGADGIGRYWVRCPTDSPCPLKEWTIVPEEAVLTTPNKVGRPIVWWYAELYNGKVKSLSVRCFMPGGGL